jgi:SpoIID/LytB domain protein
VRLKFRPARFLVALSILAATVFIAVPPAAAYPSDHVALVGHGWGHGRGMGQFGSLGYALSGSSWQDIVSHYYDVGHTTTLGPVVGNDPITVQLTDFGAGDTIVNQERGHMTVTALTLNPGNTAVLIQHAAGGLFNMLQGPSCAGPWTQSANNASGPIHIDPTQPGSDDIHEMLAACSPNKTAWYRGSLIAYPDATVNSLPIESYLRGVVPRESPASWGPMGNGAGMNALRAQAVAARSYALAENRSSEFKTCDTTSCQVYGCRARQNPDGSGFTDLEGVAPYTTTSDQAVADTSGQVIRMANNGTVARTEFSSSTGGYTAGGTFPPVVDDGDATPSNPNHTWNASIAVTDVQNAYPSVGQLQAVDVLSRNGLGDLGGRVTTVRIRGMNGSVDVSGAQFEAAFGLKSDWFAVTNNPGGGVQGYWLLGTDGGIFSFGAAGFHGSTGGIRLNQPVVGMDARTDGNGYWLVARDGGIFAYDAPFFGSMGGQHLNQPIVGMARTPTGNGYWMVASDGGIFSFGDAGFFGSMGGQHLNQPIVGMAPTTDGKGYWLVASDGGIFAFGSAGFFGSAGGTKLNKPIVGMAARSDGSGYWLVASDGGIFAYNVPFFGSLPGSKVNEEATTMRPTLDGNGYMIVSAPGSVYSYGDAPNFGGMPQAVPGYKGRIQGMALQPLPG